jgi:hypothetical protein
VSDGKHLGSHSKEEDAARACSKYLKDGIDPLKRREANTSQFKGVYWNKGEMKWKAQCKRKYLGLHTAEVAAAQAYNVEAERVGCKLNVIPPSGAAGPGAGAGECLGAGAGPKRAAPKTQTAPVASKKMKRAATTTPAVSAPSKNMKL